MTTGILFSLIGCQNKTPFEGTWDHEINDEYFGLSYTSGSAKI
jgi:uncharacterized lipoprotein NlpE involved in copper resistance